jgi:hypothetical protein
MTTKSDKWTKNDNNKTNNNNNNNNSSLQENRLRKMATMKDHDVTDDVLSVVLMSIFVTPDV